MNNHPHRSLRVGIYGMGNIATWTHLPNLRRLDRVEVVAACDVDPAAREKAAQELGIPAVYADGHEMLDHEQLDVLYSCVPAFARTNVEIAAVERGIHLFSEKPQALTMAKAHEIDAAIQRGGVLSTVGFRERYRPMVEEAQRRLADKTIVHVHFFHFSGLRGSGDHWWSDLARSGGSAFDWGVHAVDHIRYFSGLELATAQAFYGEWPERRLPLSFCLNFRLSNGGTANVTFVDAFAGAGGEFRFTVIYEGGRLDLGGPGPDHRYELLTENNEVVFEGEPVDPWFRHDQAFIEAIRTGDRSLLRCDYHDGLYTLAPILAAWESAKRDGERIDVGEFGGLERPRIS
jgi:predicted dehydrogenase